MKNKLPILILTVGLPRCGKSTWSRSTTYPIVNPDAIRLAIHGKPFDEKYEKQVWATARLMVESLFLAGHPVVILDATNTTNKARKQWDDPRWKCVYKCFDTHFETCIERAVSTRQEYLIPVIERMNNQLVWPQDNLLLKDDESRLAIEQQERLLQYQVKSLSIDNPEHY